MKALFFSSTAPSKGNPWYTFLITDTAIIVSSKKYESAEEMFDNLSVTKMGEQKQEFRYHHLDEVSYDPGYSYLTLTSVAKYSGNKIVANLVGFSSKEFEILTKAMNEASNFKRALVPISISKKISAFGPILYPLLSVPLTLFLMDKRGYMEYSYLLLLIAFPILYVLSKKIKEFKNPAKEISLKRIKKANER